MGGAWQVRVAVLMAVVAGFGVSAVNAVPAGGHGIGIWPAGAATGALLLAPRRWAGVLAAVSGGIAAGCFALFSLPATFAAATALGIAVEVWLVARLLTGGREGRPGLRTNTELSRFFVSCTAGALVVAATVLVGAWLDDRGTPWLTALTVGTAQLCSQLTVVPFFCRHRGHDSTAPALERALQWVLLAVVTLLVFWPHDFPSLVFMVLPALAWGGLRASPYEALVQALLVFGIAIQLTTFGYGPFVDVPEQYGLPVDARPLLLAVFGVDCALVVVPMLQVVGEQLGLVREAAAERDKVASIVNGTTGVAIVGTDPQGRISLFNPGAQRLLGYRPEEVLGRSPRMFHSDTAIAAKAAELGIEPDGRPAGEIFEQVVRALAAPGRAGEDVAFRRRDGVERVHSLTLSRLHDSRGRSIGFVSTSEDVTERIEALEAERTALERLREVDRVKDTFVSSVSHELRTPITSITGYLEMLEDGAFGPLEDAQVDAVRRVAANSSRLLVLIDDLLTLSRFGEDGPVPATYLLDLRDPVREAYGVVGPVWAGRDLAVALELPDRSVAVRGDPAMLERVVVNLLGNAAKFTPDGGAVRVGLEVLGPDAVLEVRDTGIGVPLAEQERIFSRFFRASTAQRQAIPGSGLGLSIARAVVERHGGSIELRSVEGEGTTVQVRLPLADPA